MTLAFDPASSRGDALRQLERVFAASGIGEPQADAAILVEDATGLSRTALTIGAEAALGAVAAARLTGWAARRLAHEPVFRIVGRRPFWTLDLAVTAAVLDPRPDTETLVAALLAAMKDRRSEPLRVLDLGTGSGAILCALLTEWPAATGLGVDRSEAAARVARENVASCGLAGRAAVAVSDWSAALAGPFDVVVSNPPYIETDAISGLAPEVRDHDPLEALDGGRDGLEAYRRLCPALPPLLAPGGVAGFEVGWTQAGAVAALMAGAGLSAIATTRDAAGHARVVTGTRP